MPTAVFGTNHIGIASLSSRLSTGWAISKQDLPGHFGEEIMKSRDFWEAMLKWYTNNPEMSFEESLVLFRAKAMDRKNGKSITAVSRTNPWQAYDILECVREKQLAQGKTPLPKRV